MRSPRSLAAALGLALAGASALAAPADPVAGAAKAQACPACHGVAGVASLPLTPSLAGQPALALTYQLIQFREKRRLAPAMNPIAEPLSDQDIKDIAAHFASLPPPPGIPQTDTARVEAGRQVAQVQHCNSCHAGQLQGQKHIPRLAGQPVDYLRAQMVKLKSGERADIDGTMASAAQVLSDADIDAVSIYAASLGP